jgi:hypothetical protein
MHLVKLGYSPQPAEPEPQAQHIVCRLTDQVRNAIGNAILLVVFFRRAKGGGAKLLGGSTVTTLSTQPLSPLLDRLFVEGANQFQSFGSNDSDANLPL